MKSIAFLLFSALFGQLLQAQAPQQAQTCKDFQLNQPVRELSIVAYTAKGTPKRYDVAQIKRSTPPKKYIFDANGRLAETQTLDPAILEMSTEKTNYKYNEKGQVLSVAQLEPDPANVYQATFGPDGLLRQYQYGNNPPHFADYSSFDNPDNPFKTVTFTSKTAKGEAISLSQTFNDKNLLAKEVSEGPNPNDRRVTTYAYNDQKQLTEIRIYDYRDKPISQTDFTYNDKGLIASFSRSSADGGIATQLKYQYLYDDKGNWIECAEIEKGFVYVVTRRTITY